MILPTDVVEVGFQLIQINFKAHVEVAIAISIVSNERVEFAIPMPKVPEARNLATELGAEVYMWDFGLHGIIV